MPSGLFYHNSLDWSVSNRRDTRLVLVLPRFIDILALNENSVHPDQTPHSAASDLGLHYLPMPLLWALGLNGLKPSLRFSFFCVFFVSKGNRLDIYCNENFSALLSVAVRLRLIFLFWACVVSLCHCMS